MRNLLILVVLCAFLASAQAQSPFDVSLEPMDIPNLGGLQSYAYARHEGQWLLIGGRLDGLHRRQPFATFDIAGHNTQLWVVDPQQGQVWTSGLGSLPQPLQAQLSATNMAFHQDGERLYIAGGYGYSASLDDHTTFPYLTALDVPALMAAVKTGGNLAPHVRYISDARFAVTGGHLKRIYGRYYLVGGQRFEGRYNPMGPDHGPGFVQEYTEEIRRFDLEDDGNTLVANHLPPLNDPALLHRRDYNVVAQILPNGQEGATAFSGVFQVAADVPYLNAVNIDSAGYAEQPAFSQYYNHYHCANVPLYSASDNAMHTLFFGGIAQYFEENGELVQDNEVPFVRTIARVTRSADGSMAEYKMPVEMPALLGAGAELILAEGLPLLPNGIVDLDALGEDTLLLAYIFGGIHSSAPNIFWINDGTQSSASAHIYKVYLHKNGSTSHAINPQSQGPLHMQVYPNPNQGLFTVRFHLAERQPLRFRISDAGTGRVLLDAALEPAQQDLGENLIDCEVPGLGEGGTYVVSISGAAGTVSQRIIVNP